MSSLLSKSSGSCLIYTLTRPNYRPQHFLIFAWTESRSKYRKLFSSSTSSAARNTKMTTPHASNDSLAPAPTDIPAEKSASKEVVNPDYTSWSTSQLIERITELEKQLHERTRKISTTSSFSSAKPNAPLRLQGNNDPSAYDITRARATDRQKKKKETRELDPSKYHTRFIALKFAYLGQRYNGYEHANGNVTPLPTIEEELWKALRRARLIFPENLQTDGWEDTKLRELRAYDITWEGCEYSKCGRTDRGVSAFGQVVGLRVRSARPRRRSDAPRRLSLQERLQEGKVIVPQQGESVIAEAPDEPLDYDASLPGEDRENIDPAPEPEPPWDDIADELPYISILNNLLPEDIRVLAWCPHPPPNFDARFSCRERRYRYFFTQPAFSPTPGPRGFRQANGKDSRLREGWLDIDAMREGAKHFVGSHDFRNFCRVDTSKQINNFSRIIYHADIELIDPQKHPLGFLGDPEFEPLKSRSLTASVSSSPEVDGFSSTPQIYSFNLYGSAFLWHQVRHMVAILFLIGQGLESPSIVAELLDVSKNPCKPMYEMASDAPLVLWDCIFPDPESDSREDTLEWIYAGDTRLTANGRNSGGGKYGQGGLVEGLWTVWRQRKMDEVLTATLLDLVVSQGSRGTANIEDSGSSESKRSRDSQKLFTGGNVAKLSGPYVPILQLRRMDPVEVQNARYLASKEQKAAKKLDNA